MIYTIAIVLIIFGRPRSQASSMSLSPPPRKVISRLPGRGMSFA